MADHSSQKQSVRLHHIKVQGDLDNMLLARQLAEELRHAQRRIEAAEHGESEVKGLIVIELDSHRWRADVVSRIVDCVTDCPVQVIAFLSDARNVRVGAGAMAIGLACSSMYIDPRTSLCGSPADDAMSLAPKGTDAAKCRLQLLQKLRPLVSRRSSDPLVVEAMMEPRSSLWLAPGDGGKRRLTPTKPGDPVAGCVQVVEVDPAGAGLRNHLSASVLVELGIGKGVAENVGRVLAAENLIAYPIVKSQVSNSLSEAVSRVGKAMESVQVELDAAEAALKKPPAREAKTESEVSRQTRAARQARERLIQARRSIGEIDAQLLEFPELLQTPLPGQNEAAMTSDKRESQWRIQLQRRRDRYEKIESKIRQMPPP
ncbi:MAG: hypothetical protein H7210_14860 [Pyrinomonadaceae bacterium]|nr:hypothetical protein [Phycisphaerales bacterium]